MKKIYINSAVYGNKICMVDDEDYATLSIYKWSLNNGKYATRQISRKGKMSGDNKHTCKQHKVLMHRIITNTLGCKDIEVDHIDGNPLNNKRNNLRVCTHSQNMKNIKPYTKRKSSLYKGVTYNKASNKWMASIHSNCDRIYLGLYVTEKMAAVAYNNAARLYHGEFANLNRGL